MSEELRTLRLREGAIEITIEELTATLGNLPPEQIVPIIRAIVECGQVQRLRQLVDALEIVTTTSAFDDESRAPILKEVAARYPFSAWLQRSRKAYNRASLLEYWDFFMKMARHGWNYNPGAINESGTSGILWRATGNLATKMAKFPGDYCHLPAILVNNAEQVEKVLREINDPMAFVEVLVGEAWDDMIKCPEFLAAFCLDEDEPGPRGCLASVMICLQV